MKWNGVQQRSSTLESRLGGLIVQRLSHIQILIHLLYANQSARYFNNLTSKYCVSSGQNTELCFHLCYLVNLCSNPDQFYLPGDLESYSKLIYSFIHYFILSIANEYLMFLYNLEHFVNLSFILSSLRFGESNNQILQTSYIHYLDELALEIGAKPDLLSLLLKEPNLAVKLYFGPCNS